MNYNIQVILLLIIRLRRRKLYLTSQLLCSNRGDLSRITPTRSPQFEFLCSVTFSWECQIHYKTYNQIYNYTEKTICQNSRRKNPVYLLGFELKTFSISSHDTTTTSGRLDTNYQGRVDIVWYLLIVFGGQKGYTSYSNV